MPTIDVTTHTPPISRGKRHQAQQQVGARVLHQQGGKDHGGPDGDDIGFEQIGRHAGAVADVVADVIRDHGGVARVVLGDPRFDLADEVGADVGRLGEDAAAKTREDRDQGGAECQRDQSVDDDPVVGRMAGDSDQIIKEAGDREQARGRQRACR